LSARAIINGWLAAASWLVVGTATAAVDALDMTLDELLAVRIVSTPKFAEHPDRIPSAISVLTAEDIRLYGWRTLGEALRSLQGFNVTSDHTYDYAGMRGVAQPGDYRPRMQVLVDGVSLVDTIYASVPVDTAFPLDIGLVERIEVIRGPSASVYGGDAMFGVINVVTRAGVGHGSTEFALTTDRGAGRRLRATWSGEIAGASALLSASAFHSSGSSLAFSDLTADGEATRVRHVGADDGRQLFFKLRGADWRLTLLHAERERTVPTGSYETLPNDTGHFETDRYDFLSLAREWRLAADQTFELHAVVGQYGNDGAFPYDYAPDNPRLFNVDKARGNWWGIENRWVYTGWRGHRLTLGLEYRANTRQDQRNDDRGYGCFDLGSPAPCLDSRESSRQATLYVQDEKIGRAHV
jgi:iron complex outermembrane receptor protein